MKWVKSTGATPLLETNTRAGNAVFCINNASSFLVAQCIPLRRVFVLFTNSLRLRRVPSSRNLRNCCHRDATCRCTSSFAIVVHFIKGFHSSFSNAKSWAGRLSLSKARRLFQQNAERFCTSTFEFYPLSICIYVPN